MTITLHVMDRNGMEHELEVLPQGSLMEALRDVEYGVTALCGGMCACATCHIFVEVEWLDRLPDQQTDERERVNDLEFRSAASRLACQIVLTEALDGLRLTLAPEE